MGQALGDHLELALKNSLEPLNNLLESIRRQGEDTEGTLGFLRGHVRWHVFLERGCDTLR